jgi:hypothetical protein
MKLKRAKVGIAVAVVIVGASFVAIATKSLPDAGIFCDLHGLTDTQREEQRALRQKLDAAVAERHELADGFSFRVATDRMSGEELMRWVGLERHCCPFLRFDIEMEPHQGATWLRLTGGPGVKEFILAEMARG